MALLLAVCGGTAALAAVSGTDITYTGDDFLQGSFLNLELLGGEVVLAETTTPLPFIWVAASARGTIVRIDVDTGAVLGEYRTAPQGRGLNPSRTTVDLFGNVWTGNRNENGIIGGVRHGSVVKVGLAVGGERVNSDETPNPTGDYLLPPFDYNTCVDRDGDGLIKTSRGLGDIRAWPNVTDGAGSTDGAAHVARVQDADDECILIYQRLYDADAVRHVSVDDNNDVWVGGYPFAQRRFYKLAEMTGAILASFNARSFGCGGYGGLIDGNGVLWSASISQNRLLRYDIGAATGSCIGISQSYGLGIDSAGNIWNSGFNFNRITKISPAGAIFPGFPKGTGGSSSDRGVAVTPDDHVWVANSGGSNVSRLDNSGLIKKVIGVGWTPTGVAVDANNKVWVTNLNSNNVMRIDPSGGGDGLGAVDLTVGLGAGAGPYNYSDMTGAVAIGSTSPQGTWTVVQDAGGTEWGILTWNTAGGFDPGGGIQVEARAAETEAGLASQPFTEATNGVPLDPSLFGRFIEVRVTLSPVNDVEPVLNDLRVQIANHPPEALCQDATAVAGDECQAAAAQASIDAGSFDPDGDPITLTQDPPGPYELGDTLVTLTIEDDQGASDSCQATVTVVDQSLPTALCNAPATIIPPDAPISFTATAEDNCSVAGVEILSYDCFKFTKKGKRIDKTESCEVAIEGDTITILDSGGVGDNITWTVAATDGSGNSSTTECALLVVNPGQGKNK